MNEFFPADIVRPAGLDYARTTIYDILAQIPGYDRYQTSEAVLQGFGDLCQALAAKAGESGVHVRLETTDPGPEIGEPLDALVIELPEVDDLPDITADTPEGFATMVLLGNLHTNEVMWTNTFHFVSNFFAHNPELMRKLGIKRVILLDAFPGGMALNGQEIFEPGDMPLDGYLGASVRSIRQPDWDFSVNSGDYEHMSSLPGTRVAEILMQKYLPQVLGRLHNSGIDGVDVYIDRAVASLVHDLVALREAVRPPMPPCMQDDTPVETIHAPGVYTMYGFKDSPDQDLLKELGMGCSSQDYLKELLKNTGLPSVCINLEVPYYVAPVLLLDATPSGKTELETREEFMPLIDAMLKQMRAIVQAAGQLDLSPEDQHLYDSTKDLAYIWEQHVADMAGNTDQLAQELTVAERAEFYKRWVLYLAITFGQAARLALKIGADTPTPTQTLQKVTKRTKEILDPHFTSRRTQVAMQIGGVLLTLIALRQEAAAERN